MATHDTNPQICCGDTNFCKACPVFAANPDPESRKGMSFTLNALGRCDFYKGPDEVNAPIASIL